MANPKITIGPYVPGKWSAGSTRISTGTDAKLDIWKSEAVWQMRGGYINGPWLIFKQGIGSHQWNLTHVRTGLAINKFLPSKTKAQNLAHALCGTRAKWDKRDPLRGISKEEKDRIKEMAGKR